MFDNITISQIIVYVLIFILIVLIAILFKKNSDTKNNLQNFSNTLSNVVDENGNVNLPALSQTVGNINNNLLNLTTKVNAAIDDKGNINLPHNNGIILGNGLWGIGVLTGNGALRFSQQPGFAPPPNTGNGNGPSLGVLSYDIPYNPNVK